MSRKSNDWAWQQVLKPSLKLTLLALADRTNENHECFPSYQRLVKDTNLNIKTIQKNIGILCTTGMIKDTGGRVGKTGQVKVYRFTFKYTLNRNDTENGTVSKPPKSGCLKPPKSGRLKDTLNRATEPPSIQPPIEPPSIAEGLKPTASDSKGEPKSKQTWTAYSQAYSRRYGHEPVRNQSVNAMLCKLVDFVGKDEAPHIADYYLSLNKSFYTQSNHPVSLLTRDYQSIRTQWINNTNQTSIDARQVEQQTSALNAHSNVKGMIERGEL